MVGGSNVVWGVEKKKPTTKKKQEIETRTEKKANKNKVLLTPTKKNVFAPIETKRKEKKTNSEDNSGF